MNDKQKKFCEGRRHGLTNTEAALLAGYNPKGIRNTVFRLTHQSREVMAYLAALETPSGKQAAVEEEILLFLTAVMRGEIRQPVLRQEKTGVKVVDSMELDPQQRMRAAELIGKHYHLWGDRTEASEPMTLRFISGDHLED